MSRSTPTFRRTASPHGSPSHSTYGMCSSIVKLSFLACSFLFARAFVSYDYEPIGLRTSHLPSHNVISRDGILYNTTSPGGLYQDTLPPSWNPAMATNLTNDNELGHVFAQKPDSHVLPSAADNSGDTPDKEQGLLMTVTGNKTPRMETSRTPSVLFSSNTHDLDLSPGDRMTNWQDYDYKDQDEYLSSNVDPDSEAYGFQTVTPQTQLSHSRDDPDTSIDDEPFFSLEEYDGEREIFALKIWIDRKELQRARLGKVQYCQASSGINCLSEN